MALNLADLNLALEVQEKGTEFELLHPVTFEPTGIRVTIAGPDSERQREASFDYQDKLSGARPWRQPNGSFRRITSKPHASSREQAQQEFLADIIIDWDVEENGEKVPFSRENVGRLIRAGAWVKDQITAFARSRAPYLPASDSTFATRRDQEAE